MNHTIDERCLALVKQSEGCRLNAYQDKGGTWTIGTGHTGPEVHGGLSITQEEADRLLEADLQHAVEDVNRLVSVSLTPGQCGALVDFAFNFGFTKLANSTLLKYVNKGMLEAASKEFGKWIYDAGQVEQGLVTRRANEQKLFMS